ncbi:helicase C-terminal domain-containing protein [Microbacterium sp. NPDC097977]|uniref:helicase C-terminal domain-containing protein n=1 Tax=Microbacterium sp. NPDC097977 TaxID=3155686 RepID=UPI00331E8DE7
MDYDALMREAEAGKETEPRELYEQLPSKVPGYGYLRDVQAQVLTAWDKQRGNRDIVLKVNTGGGKTIDGLVILQSYLNDGVAPALYVAPDKYLASQVIAEAANLGIAVTADPESSEYRAGEAIAVVNAAKLFNGHSIFSESRDPGHRVPIGVVVIDDAHAALATVRSQFSVTIARTNATYSTLLALFEADLDAQSADILLDIKDDRGSAFARVPFWAVRNRLSDLRAALRAYAPDNPTDFSYDAIRDVLALCRVVFTRSGVTITPPCPPVRRVVSFAEAKHRVFLTATLADDSVLVSEFGADATLVNSPIHPISAGDIGERMILAPQEINDSISAQSIRDAVVDLSRTHNTLVIVPSNKAMAAWPDSAHKLTASDLGAFIPKMRKSQVGLVVVANKYDGIDLPQDACRVLVLDGLPQAFSGDERLNALMSTSIASIDDRQVQRLEQGMGRGVRSNEDHCVVFLLGRRLARLTIDPQTVSRFSPATRAQLAASRQVAKRLDDTPLEKILATANDALTREPGWVRFAKSALRKLTPEPARVDAATVAEREAFDTATHGDLAAACAILCEAATSATDERRAGALLEQAAAYVDHIDPTRAQQLLAEARKKNFYVLKPMAGITYTPLSYAGAQANTIASRLTAKYGTPATMRVGVESILDSLTFDPDATEEFEEAVFELGKFLGFNSQRPERELGAGPDNLWMLDTGMFWVIEDKSGATSEFIAKRDAGQLAQSKLWFDKHYSPTDVATPVMVHHSRKLYKDATAPTGMRIVDGQVLGQLIHDVRAFSEGLAATGWHDAKEIDRLLEGHNLRPAHLDARLKRTTGGTA